MKYGGDGLPKTCPLKRGFFFRAILSKKAVDWGSCSASLKECKEGCYLRLEYCNKLEVECKNKVELLKQHIDFNKQ